MTSASTRFFPAEDLSRREAHRVLIDANLDTQENRDFLHIHTTYQALLLAYSLRNLSQAGILTPENRILISQYDHHSGSVCSALIILHRAELNTADNQLLITEDPEHVGEKAACLEWLKCFGLYNATNRSQFLNTYQVLLQNIAHSPWTEELEMKIKLNHFCSAIRLAPELNQGEFDNLCHSIVAVPSPSQRLGN